MQVNTQNERMKSEELYVQKRNHNGRLNGEVHCHNHQGTDCIKMRTELDEAQVKLQQKITQEAEVKDEKEEVPRGAHCRDQERN